MVYLIFCGQDSSLDETEKGGMTVLWIIAMISLFFGIVLVFEPIRSLFAIKSGKHPLIAAIESKDFGYIIWLHEYKNKLKSRGTDKSIWMYTLTGKKFVLSFKKGKLTEALTYLSTVFPDAQVGYSDEARDKIYHLKKGSR